MSTGMWWKTAAAGLVGAAAAWTVLAPATAGDGASDPTPGLRQKEHKNKLWPPFPRPTTPKAKWHDQFHYAHYWPYPQACEDRNSVRNALDQQVRNGWIAETTLYDQHFDPVTHQLNNSGKHHLRWILVSVPMQHRTAFIQMTSHPQFDQARLASVQDSAGEVVRDGQLPPILMRQTLNHGTSAQELDSLRRKYIASQPIPRLPVSSISGGGASSAGSQGM